MKKIYFLLFFILYTLFSFSQNKKKALTIISYDIGITHSSKFKKVYNPKYTPPNGLLAFPIETEYPGFYDIPTTSFQAGIKYTFKFQRGILFSTGLYYSNRQTIHERSKDSVERYFLFSDSVKRLLNFEYANAPLYEKKSPNSIEIHANFGYQYKRLY